MILKGVSADMLVDWVRGAVQVFSQLPGMEMENCGYCTIRSVVDGRVLLTFEVGHCPDEKAAKYWALSIEKGQRLFNHPDHASSFQSRDENATVQVFGEVQEWGHWAGAIRALDGILSFSGLPELGDEAVMLIAGIKSRRLFGSGAQKIAEISSNPYLEPMIRASGAMPLSAWE